MRNERLIVGIDLGGTRFRVCLAEPSGRILSRLSRATEADLGPDVVVANIVSAVHDLVGRDQITQVAGVGAGAPGPLDPREGVVLQAPNLPGWHDLPLRRMLGDQLGLPVYLGNDANLAALGEWRFGAGRGHQNVAYLTVSTGVGGGVVEGGRLLLGARGLAAEVGHMVIEPDGPLCGCGNRGCLEAVASGTAIARVARERLASGAPGLLRELAGGDMDLVDASLVATAAARGDPLAAAVMRVAATYLGIGVVNVLHLYDPEVIIIGGGVSTAGEMVFGPVREVVHTRAMAAYRERASIVPAALGDDGGLLGAVALVAENLDR